ncbi:MAG: response regulator [Acidobacteriaceae bacterium]|nr:response regulator [Acidobacteriaceae bacterium]
MVEDNIGDVFLVQEAVAAAKLDVDLYFFSDGDEIVQFVAEIEHDSVRCPELLLLDLNLPKRDGFQVLSYLRSSKHCVSMRVAIMTSSRARADREKSASLNVDYYFNKPGSYEEFLKIGDVIRELI